MNSSRHTFRSIVELARTDRPPVIDVATSVVARIRDEKLQSPTITSDYYLPVASGFAAAAAAIAILMIVRTGDDSYERTAMWLNELMMVWP